MSEESTEQDDPSDPAAAETSAAETSTETPAGEDRLAVVEQAVRAVQQALCEQGESQKQLIAHMDQTIGMLAGELSVLAQEMRREFEQTAAARDGEDAAQRQDAERAQQAQTEQSLRLNHLQQVVFGDELAADAVTADERQTLLDAALAGEPAACRLTGQLFLIQAATAERLPSLLSELGEAYYAWHPKLDEAPIAMEQAMVELVHRRGDELGTPNRIELVRSGDRFDNGFHDSKSRGAEVSQVHGWIVLRGNGKVYTRARVSVQ